MRPVSGPWRKSSYSPHDSNCVEVGQGLGVRGVRDSKLGEDSPILVFEARVFRSFLRAVKSGRFDI